MAQLVGHDGISVLQLGGRCDGNVVNGIEDWFTCGEQKITFPIGAPRITDYQNGVASGDNGK